MSGKRQERENTLNQYLQRWMVLVPIPMLNCISGDQLRADVLDKALMRAVVLTDGLTEHSRDVLKYLVSSKLLLTTFP
jgi:hypothetical protein